MARGGEMVPEAAHLRRGAGESVNQQAASHAATNAKRPQLCRVDGAAPDRFRFNRHHFRSLSARKFIKRDPVIRAGDMSPPGMPRRRTGAGGEKRMALVGWLVALLLGIVLALFSVGNQQPASINVLGTTYQGIPTWTVMLASAALGALMVLVVSLVDRLRWFMTSRYTKKVLHEHKRMIMQRDDRIAELEQEVMRLRGAA